MGDGVRYHGRLCSRPGSTNVRRRSTRPHAFRKAKARPRGRRDADARLAADPRQSRRHRHDDDRLRDAGPPFAAGARRGRARLQPLPAGVPARDRRRLGRVADRRGEDRRGRFVRRRPTLGPPGVSLRPRHRRGHLDLPVPDDGDPDGDRRTARACPRRRPLHAGLPMGPCAQPAVLRRPLAVCGGRAPAPAPARRPDRGRLQRASPTTS